MTIPSDPRRRTRTSWFWVRAVVTVALISYLVARLDWDLARASLARTSVPLVLLAAGVFATTSGIDLARFRTAITRLGVSWGTVFRLHAIGLFFATFLPGQTGADVYRIGALNRRGHDLATTTSLVLMQRACGLVALLAGASIALLIEGPRVLDVRASQGFAETTRIALGLAVGVAIAIVLLRLSFPRSYSSVAKRAREASRRATFAIRSLGVSRTLTILALSATAVAGRALVLSLLLVAAEVHISSVQVVLIACSTSLATQLPLSLGGLGVREYSLVALLGAFSVSQEVAIQTAFASRLFMVAIALVGGSVLVASPLQVPPTTEGGR